MQQDKSINKLNRKQKDMLFYIIMMAYPVIQFCIFYIGVNFNSILLAFKQYDHSVKGFGASGFVWVGFQNFVDVFSRFKTDAALSSSLGNSLTVYVVTTVVMATITIWFAYYIFKKKFASQIFRVILFLPQVISPIVIAVMFTMVAEEVIPDLLLKVGIKIPSLFSPKHPDIAFGTSLFYSIWGSFGTSIILYNGSMSNIDPEILEAGKIDGSDGFKEFLHIIFPLVYPTFSTFFITHIAGIFTNQMSLHALYGIAAPSDLNTFGYYMFVKTQQASSFSDYPFLSAMGLMMTLIAVPATLIVRYFMRKIGPSVD